MNPLLPMTRALLYANVGAFCVQMFADDSILYRFALWPWGTPLFQPWQLLTYAFLHGGWMHLFFNMFALYMFGSEVERQLGARRYLIYYLASVVGAALAQLLVSPWLGGLLAPTVGASGGVFGLLLAFGMFFPQRRILLLIPPIPIKAWLFVLLYGLLELGLGVFGSQQGVAHFAHLGGMLAGFILLSYWRRTPQPA